MAILVKTSPSVHVLRNLNNPDRFASLELDVGSRPVIRAWMINANSARVAGSRDCQFSVSTIEVVVNFVVRLNAPKIDRGYFDPDLENPHGYEADAAHDPSHLKLDETNVLVHEYSHAMDVVNAVDNRLTREFNRPGVQEQLTLFWPCEDENGVYRIFFRRVQERIQAIGLEAFIQLVAEFERHRGDSETEQKARRAQILEYESREN